MPADEGDFFAFAVDPLVGTGMPVSRERHDADTVAHIAAPCQHEWFLDLHPIRTRNEKGATARAVTPWIRWWAMKDSFRSDLAGSSPNPTCRAATKFSLRTLSGNILPEIEGRLRAILHMPA